MSLARGGRDIGSIEPRSGSASAPSGHRTLGRLVGALGLVVLTALLYWMLTDEAFTVTDEQVSFRGLALADEAEVRARLTDIERGPNVFRVRASRIVSELASLTEVDAASAVVTLPADVSVTLDERDPVFVWRHGAKAWLVDEAGTLFAPVDAKTALDEDTPEGAVRSRLPVVLDQRLTEEPPAEGDHLSAIDLSVMRQLLALDSERLGPRATELELRVDDRAGYVLSSRDRAWQAYFGTYTLTLQPPDVIPRQAQCLEWLLASGPRQLSEAWLVVSEGGCGTYLP